ncbi:MAG: PAS domain S-box protein, partial [Candidatus Bathyarchaeota archaeon]
NLEEIKGKQLLDVIVPLDKLEEGKMLDEKAKRGHIYYDTIRNRNDGSLVPVSVSAAPITVEGQLTGYMGVYKDITKQKRAEKELEESRRHFKTLFDLMVDPVAIVDKKGKILEVTRKAEEITGFKKEDLVGKNFLKTKIATTKSKAIMMKNLAKRMIGMHMAPYEVEMLTKDGKRLPHEINAAKIEYKGKPADMVVFRNISERKKMEEKLRVVGKLTRHDVRNKLTAITGNIYLIRKKLSEDHKSMIFLEEIEKACNQVEKIFNFARNYERLGIEELSYVRIDKTLREAISLFSDLQGVEIVEECNGLKVLADSLLRQIFYNLIDNSLKYGEKVTKIKIFFEEKGNKLKLIYEEIDGTGIPATEKEKIFKEGYGKGTGYGLYLIMKISEVYGWTIKETGNYGEGAKFVATIPKMNEEGKESYKF